MHLLMCGFLLGDTDGTRSRMPMWGLWGVTPGKPPVMYLSTESHMIGCNLHRQADGTACPITQHNEDPPRDHKGRQAGHRNDVVQI